MVETWRQRETPTSLGRDVSKIQLLAHLAFKQLSTQPPACEPLFGNAGHRQPCARHLDLGFVPPPRTMADQETHAAHPLSETTWLTAEADFRCATLAVAPALLQGRGKKSQRVQNVAVGLLACGVCVAPAIEYYKGVRSAFLRARWLAFKCHFVFLFPNPPFAPGSLTSLDVRFALR